LWPGRQLTIRVERIGGERIPQSLRNVISRFSNDDIQRTANLPRRGTGKSQRATPSNNPAGYVVRRFAHRKNRCTEAKHLLAGYQPSRFMIEIAWQKFGDVVEEMGEML
jgi:hypothetical protein